MYLSGKLTQASFDSFIYIYLTEPPKAHLDSKLLSETVMVRAGSDLVLDAAVGGRPDPKAFWSKGNRELEMCEKYHLQYTTTRAMAVIKFCDRDDTGKYILTARNVSGTKTAEVNVKVLGKYFLLVYHLHYLSFLITCSAFLQSVLT